MPNLATSLDSHTDALHPALANDMRAATPSDMIASAPVAKRDEAAEDSALQPKNIKVTPATGYTHSATSRQPLPPQPSLAFLDGLRWLLFLWIFTMHLTSMFFVRYTHNRVVAFHHENHTLLELVHLAHYAPHGFFLMSAYFAATRAFEVMERTGWGVRSIAAYIRHRFARLSPAYYSYIALMLALQYAGNSVHNLQFAWRNVLYVHNYYKFQEQFTAHTWTNGVEMQFAVALPVVLALTALIERTVSRIQQRRGGVSPATRTASTSAAQPPISHFTFGTLCLLLLIGQSLYRYHASMLYLRAGHQLPIAIRTVDHYHLTISDKVINGAFNSYFRLLYAPLHARLDALVCGVYVAYMRRYGTNGNTTFTYTTRKFIRVLFWLGVSCVGKATSHEGDVRYSMQASAVMLTIGRCMFSATAAVLFYWALQWNDVVHNQRNPSSVQVATDTSPTATTPTHVPTLFRFVRSFLSMRVFRWIAPLTYSAYIYHILIVGIVLTVPVQADIPITLSATALWFVLTIIPTLLISAIVHYVIERPILRFIERRRSAAKTKLA